MENRKFVTSAVLAAAALVLSSCASMDMEDTLPVEFAGKTGSARTIEEEMRINYAEENRIVVDEDMKEVDVEKTVVYVEKPVYYPVEPPAPAPVKGKAAALKSLDAATQLPEKWNGGKMFYDFQENFVYEIYCQPWRITDIALEPGEMVLEHPFLSESQVWELGAGVSRTNGQDTQHFYLKPDKSNLITSMIIITDRRTYHFLLKSFKDCYMAMVEFEYPNTMPYTINTGAMEERASSINSHFKGVNGIDPRFLSFDYKMSYSIFRKPIWLPKRVYDDGMRTYIQMDERVLHTRAPVIFNKRNERINYRVDKNLIVIDELIEKLTMRNGKQKVVIKKKTYFDEEEELDQKKIEEEAKLEEEPRRGWQLHMQFPEKKEEEKKDAAPVKKDPLPQPATLPPEDNPYSQQPAAGKEQK